MQMQYRQGDLLFVRLDIQPAGELTVRQNAVIVVGEATGHAHRLQTGRAGMILEDFDGSLYLNIAHMTQVVHEEHSPIILDPGWWLVIRQREYTPDAMGTVAD
jgi:hypothetical protein